MAKVGVIMGSLSDFETMKEACQVLEDLNIEYEKDIISAHRTPEDLFTYGQEAASRGLSVIIAGAGGAAHLPGMIASITVLPVIGVPVQSKALQGMDSLLSIAQMPGGVPVATMAIGKAGAKNAGLFAASIIGLMDSTVYERLLSYRIELKERVHKMRRELHE
ncbi:N5-carboxyaminoimidazole ribonucleotide mutase [Pontibacillus halophilus JSM 076056 = DSM 19796]|uniref:N5-carboxyaminoimidazole ribonucleotide mutase n=1 Tax=Pontibacillus halophilus JSM 076056 = DSM 19796 TaxID=1385510 RepID=A0A0A5GAP4_9BACI|nr:5-(carboxyamino)imidazole ribonucleotide mutase [Pontibacillus halophilus]KGX90246.1 N5-carboxyaminoimidazole ribonucleotide mutase [Pontibacillus halophilus JSM 076056 = DSM 19796]